jgi:hypothetical protein
MHAAEEEEEEKQQEAVRHLYKEQRHAWVQTCTHARTKKNKQQSKTWRAGKVKRQFRESATGLTVGAQLRSCGPGWEGGVRECARRVCWDSTEQSQAERLREHAATDLGVRRASVRTSGSAERGAECERVRASASEKLHGERLS